MAEEVQEKKPLSEREVKRQEREQRQTDAANKEKQLKAEYYKIKDNPAFLDLKEKLRSFADYHSKVARDGVGYDQNPDLVEPVVVHLTPDHRLSELDKAAGIEEIIDYLDRKIA